MLEGEQDGEWVTYLNGDLYSQASPAPIYQQLEGSLVPIVSHRYAAAIERLKRFKTCDLGWVWRLQ